MVTAPMPVTVTVNAITRAELLVKAVAAQVDVVATEIGAPNRNAMVVARIEINYHLMVVIH